MDNSSRRKGKNPIPYHHDMRKERNKKLYGTKTSWPQFVH